MMSSWKIVVIYIIGCLHCSIEKISVGKIPHQLSLIDENLNELSSFS